jgi:alpha-D-ribose 1-methylphosphonate 5-triphosphate diphosphatase PhnM
MLDIQDYYIHLESFRYIYRRQFRSQTSDNMQRWAESEKRRAEERRSEKRKRKRKEDASARKGSKVAKHCFSNDLWLQRVEK